MMDSPKKKQKMQSLKERACIICSKQTSESELTKPRDDESVGVLLHAANLWNFGPILELKEDEYGEKLFYHRDCRSDFTHKKMLQKFQEPDSEPECSTKGRKSSRAPSTTSRVLDPVCIFCEKESKYVAGSNTKETLLQSRELRSDETVRSVAQAKLDQRILAITSRELVAAEAHYHKSCYCKYTRGAMEKTSKVTEDDDAYLAAEWEAYLLLFKHVRKTLFIQPEVVRMIELTEKLLNFLHELGINDVKPSTRKHIRRKLECEFKKSLHFVSDDKGKLLVYSDGLSLEQVVVKMMKAEEQLQDAKYSDDIENIVKLSANHLRGQIKNMKEKPWPPHPAELKPGYTELPESLKMFLKLLLHGTEQDGTQKVERVVQSVGQDCIYAVSRGKVVPAKHILLPWGVKSLTGNVELIKMLNRLGHGVSYSKLEEIDTALCLQKQMKEADRGIVLPSSSHPCIPSSLAYDNIDRLEETLSGAFSGRGMLAALKLLMLHDHFRDVFAKLGKEWQLTDEILKVLEEFTCRLYVSQSEICDVNEMRYELFRVKDGNVESGQLPSCQNCLHLHATRANYQAAIWHRVLQADPEVPSPLENKGWSLGDDGELINWMTAAPAPDTVLEFLSCKCKKSCKLPTCQCMVNGLHCTQACLLQEYENMKNEEVHAEQEEGSDGSDSDTL